VPGREPTAGAHGGSPRREPGGGAGGRCRGAVPGGGAGGRCRGAVPGGGAARAGRVDTRRHPVYSLAQMYDNGPQVNDQRHPGARHRQEEPRPPSDLRPSAAPQWPEERHRLAEYEVECAYRQGFADGYAQCDADLVAALARALGGPGRPDYRAAVRRHGREADRRRARAVWDAHAGDHRPGDFPGRQPPEGAGGARADRSGPDQTGTDQTRPDQAGPDQTGTDQTRPDQAGPDQTSMDQTDPDQTSPDQTGTDRAAA
jgi:hypothetical protein